MKNYTLNPTDGRKSFYGKCSVSEINGTKYLKSYDTTVACIDRGGNFIRLWNKWSATTMRHVNAFRVANDLPQICKREWMAMDVGKNNEMWDRVAEYHKVMGREII